MCFLFYFCLFRVCCGNSGGQEESPLVRQRDDHPSGDLGRPTGKAQCHNPCTLQKIFWKCPIYCCFILYYFTLLLLHGILPSFRSSSALDATHTTVTFSLKFQRSLPLTATPAAPSSATRGSNVWRGTIASVGKTWGKNCTSGVPHRWSDFVLTHLSYCH